MATNTCSSVVQQMLLSSFLNPGGEVYDCLTFLGNTSTQLKGQNGAFGEAQRKNSIATNKGAEDLLLERGGYAEGEKRAMRGHTDFRAEIIWVERLIFPRDLEEKVGFRNTDP